MSHMHVKMRSVIRKPRDMPNPLAHGIQPSVWIGSPQYNSDQMRSSNGATSRHLLLFLTCVFALPALLAVAIAETAALPSRAIRTGEAVAQVDTRRFGRIGPLIESAISDGDLPGAVVLVWHQGETVYHEAFGRRMVEPVSELMTTDTIFDLASLTKVVATAPAVMMLVQDGLIRLRDPVARYIPGFDRHGKGGIRVEHLLTHVSGLRPDFPLEQEFQGHETAIALAIDEYLVDPPGARFVYSDINFIVLAEIVSRVSGESFERFVEDRLFGPLRMSETGFLPSSRKRSRIAPTERCRPFGWPCGDPGASMLRGTVHDPTARRMGGVAGHAGLFGTADDLSRFGAMMLGGGVLDDVRVMSPLTVARMTRAATPLSMADRRGLGWDISSRYSSNRGDLFSTDSYGHTGFTGTSLWLDPESQTVVVFLSNRVHPDGTGNITALRGRVATVAAAAVTGVSLSNGASEVTTGVDTLQREMFARLDGHRVGLLTNQSGRASDGTTTIDLLARAPNVDLHALFSPEHGVRGDLDSAIPDIVDSTTGLTVHSLYGETQRPRPATLEGLETIVVDLQDVGARFYTYATTMAYVLEAAAERDIRVVVLDRPNPITGIAVEGPLLDEDQRGFTGYLSMPTRHGLTLGEMARVFNAERGLGVDLEVVAMEGWRRRMWYDETGLFWFNPSPNLRSVGQTVLYPGIGSIEGTNLSVGRGTDTPFEHLGAPWIDGGALATSLNARGLDGVQFYPVQFTPESSTYAGEVCRGVRITVTNREMLRPVRVGLEIAAALYRLHPTAFDLDSALRLLGSRETIERIRAGDDPSDISTDWVAGERDWSRRIAPYLLYEP